MDSGVRQPRTMTSTSCGASPALKAVLICGPPTAGSLGCPEIVFFRRFSDPVLHYEPTEQSWPDGTEETALVLDRLEVPLDASIFRLPAPPEEVDVTDNVGDSSISGPPD